MTPLSLLLRVFLQIGFFSIGGGYAIIPLIQEQVVDTYGWISQKAFTDMITISQMTPGPLAVNTSTFVGLQIAGIPGAVLATAGCVISGILISLALYLFFGRHKESRCVFEVLKGLKSASVGLILSAAATILLLAFCGENHTAASPSLSGMEAAVHFLAGIDWIAVALFSVSFILLRWKKFSPTLLMVLTGACGLLLYR